MKNFSKDELERALAVLAVISDPMALENRTFFVEVGQPTFDPEDFDTKSVVTVNGVEVGEVCMECVVDHISNMKNPKAVRLEYGAPGFEVSPSYGGPPVKAY